MSGAISLLQEQLLHVASKHLAPPQCRALEAMAEELSPPPGGRLGGVGVCQGLLLAPSELLWLFF